MIKPNSRQFSIVHVALITFSISLLTCGAVYYYTHKQNELTLASNSDSRYCDYNVKRMTGLKYVKPILWVDDECESEALMGTKQKLVEVIEKYKKYDGVANASVYLRSGTNWTIVNESEKYLPGSLFKVPILITILKMEEDNPGFLNKVVKYDHVYPLEKHVNYVSKTIVLGQSYSIKELLSYMIKYSDNAATVLLERYMDSKTLQKLFKDIGVEVPNAYADQYLFTVKDYSLFMRTIYNAGILTIKNSEFAAELLSESEFKDGILKGIPANTKVAHKFGEAGDPNQKQLHESAIVYIENGGYLLTIMTKGKDIKKLSELIGELSRVVYTDEINMSK